LVFKESLQESSIFGGKTMVSCKSSIKPIDGSCNLFENCVTLSKKEKASDGKLSANTSKHVLGGAPTAESRILLISMSGLREFQAQDE
jgi:hypothetical protein